MLQYVKIYKIPKVHIYNIYNIYYNTLDNRNFYRDSIFSIILRD